MNKKASKDLVLDSVTKERLLKFLKYSEPIINYSVITWDEKDEENNDFYKKECKELIELLKK